MKKIENMFFFITPEDGIMSEREKNTNLFVFDERQND